MFTIQLYNLTYLNVSLQSFLFFQKVKIYNRSSSFSCIFIHHNIMTTSIVTY